MQEQIDALKKEVEVWKTHAQNYCSKANRAYARIGDFSREEKQLEDDQRAADARERAMMHSLIDDLKRQLATQKQAHMNQIDALKELISFTS